MHRKSGCTHEYAENMRHFPSSRTKQLQSRASTPCTCHKKARATDQGMDNSCVSAARSQAFRFQVIFCLCCFKLWPAHSLYIKQSTVGLTTRRLTDMLRLAINMRHCHFYSFPPLQPRQARNMPTPTHSVLHTALPQCARTNNRISLLLVSFATSRLNDIPQTATQQEPSCQLAMSYHYFSLPSLF